MFYDELAMCWLSNIQTCILLFDYAPWFRLILCPLPFTVGCTLKEANCRSLWRWSMVAIWLSYPMVVQSTQFRGKWSNCLCLLLIQTNYLVIYLDKVSIYFLLLAHHVLILSLAMKFLILFVFYNQLQRSWNWLALIHWMVCVLISSLSGRLITQTG